MAIAINPAISAALNELPKYHSYRFSGVLKLLKRGITIIKPKMMALTIIGKLILFSPFIVFMAGKSGFEPEIPESKSGALTAWLLPY